MTEKEIIALIENDPWMMQVLHATESMNLPDWMIGAGFVRNKVWDELHGYQREVVDTADIDLIYFDSKNLSEQKEKDIDTELRKKININWATKNQARMHVVNNNDPYVSSRDALAHWVETATAVAVKIENGYPKLITPYGLDDLVSLIVRPTPYFKNDLEKFYERIEKKQWLKKWPKLKVATGE